MNVISTRSTNKITPLKSINKIYKHRKMCLHVSFKFSCSSRVYVSRCVARDSHLQKGAQMLLFFFSALILLLFLLLSFHFRLVGTTHSIWNCNWPPFLNCFSCLFWLRGVCDVCCVCCVYVVSVVSAVCVCCAYVYAAIKPHRPHI